MIKDFLIINFTGKNNILGLNINNKFFKKKILNKENSNEFLVNNIVNFLKENNINLDKNISILINQGPGSFSSIRVSLAVAKGINITFGSKLYGYKNSQLGEFNLENIEILLKKKSLENKLIKPIYIS